MDEYTPGPWEISHVGGTYQHAIHAGMKSIAFTIPCTVEEHDENEANARLIAAAPDLLAERDRLHGVLESIVNDFTDWDDSIARFHIFKLARAALEEENDA